MKKTAAKGKSFHSSVLLSWMLTLLLGGAAWLFWRVGYPHALAFHEQFQLFLFDGGYLCQRLAVPGGLAQWLGELLTQFYNNAMAGALVVALLFVAVQRLVLRLSAMPLLSLVPALLLWRTMGDENVLLAYGVGLVLAMVCMCALDGCRRRGVLLAIAVVGLPLLYWMIGPLALMVAVYMVLCLPLQRGVGRGAVLATGLAGVVAVVLCLVGSPHVVPYPLDRLAVGLAYYRFPTVLPLMFVAIPAVVVLLSAAAKAGVADWLERKTGRLATTAAAAVVMAATALLVPGGFDAKRYELIDYDYLVRTAQWQAITAKAERQQPDLPMSVAANNLALAMQNQLCERGFAFYQHGTQGLVPNFERNFATALLTGEIYFRLGMVNTAQRFAFEAMEAQPNYAKSTRVMKRLAETNLVNGQYDVARKYLNLLKKTLFYSRWARQTEALLDDEAAINAHPLYGWLRQVRLQDDFLFSDLEIDRICGQLFLHNPQNAMAVQYLLMWPLLRRDLPTFVQYLQAVQERMPYNPRHVQEAMAVAVELQKGIRPQKGKNKLQDYLLSEP